MFYLAYLISTAISVVIYIIIAQIVLFWLVEFEVIKTRSFRAMHLMNNLNHFCDRLYRPVRRWVPPLGGMDISPIIVIVGLNILQSLVWQVLT